jgi:hypothetical protein
MRSLTRQKGMTGIGWLIVLGLVGFFVLLALKMVPVYHKVVSTLESIAKESGYESPREIRDLLERRFDISYVSTITHKDVIIKSAGRNFNIRAKYDAREHLFGNVSVMMSFDKQVVAKKF